ncbi:Dehydrodolichyl diphosphate synthase, partial [Tetrabaena socialis]
DNGLAEREGIRMRIVGDLALPPPAVQGAAARLMRKTGALPRQRATLNVCFSYTSSEETVTAVHELQAAVRSGRLLPYDVCAEALRGSLRTGPDCPPVDLLLRTSGETRLSDFALWQAEHAQLCYLPTLWPDLSYADFAGAVLSYQGAARALAALRRAAEARLRQAAGFGAGEGEREGEEPPLPAGRGLALALRVRLRLAPRRGLPPPPLAGLWLRLRLPLLPRGAGLA